jgi:hypothetical protein
MIYSSNSLIAATGAAGVFERDWPLPRSGQRLPLCWPTQKQHECQAQPRAVAAMERLVVQCFSCFLAARLTRLKLAE